VRKFQFRLEQVLAWRRAESEVVEYKLRRLSLELDQIERSRAQVALDRTTAERGLLRASAVSGADLSAHAAHLAGLDRQEQVLRQRREVQERLVSEQHQRLTEARRRLRLLEKLKVRTFAEWRAAADRELEEFAAESHLARWNAGVRKSRRESASGLKSFSQDR
jgi:flagellar export protein FliJ